jgi:hypothetical protein
MARCIGANPPYGCGHFREHQIAAKKGWITRRAAATFKTTEEHAALAALFGDPIEAAHEHPDHKNMVRFKHKGKWYELPRSEFRRLVEEGKKLQREQAREEKRQARNLQREERYKRAQDRQLAAVRRAEYQGVVRLIRENHGIHPNRALSNGKIPELEEWQGLPLSVKTRDRRRGLSLDEMATEVRAHFPWLKINNGDDLAEYLKREAHYQREKRAS